MPRQNLTTLFAAAHQAAGEEARADARRAARGAFVKQRMAALREAQASADAAWGRLIDSLDDMDEEEADAVPPPPEQAAADALLAEIRAICDHDKWPREMYWRCV